jgi:prolyl oligopeptidase
MVARLQDATSSDAPILLRTSANTGHGIGSPLGAQVEEWTDIFAFLFQTLAVPYGSK